MMAHPIPNALEITRRLYSGLLGSDGLSEWRTTAEWDWVEFPNGEALHAPLWTFSEDEDGCHADGFVACRRGGRLWIPGLGARLSAPRCKQCCRAVGIPEGVGSPKNDDALRPFIEARLQEIAELTAEFAGGNS